MKVTLKRSWGNDLDVVNNARVSFGKESVLEQGEWLEDGQGTYIDMKLKDSDKGLIKYLASGLTASEREEQGKTSAHVHWTPFANGIGATFHFKIPIFVANQLKKHQVGFTVSEISRRYVTDTPEFYTPTDGWRKASKDVKQGSSEELVGESVTGYNYAVARALSDYRSMLDLGICAEQARMILPQSMYTEIIMSGSLYGWSNVYNQRIDPHAQKEIQGIAKQIGDICSELWPVSWKELTNDH